MKASPQSGLQAAPVPVPFPILAAWIAICTRNDIAMLLLNPDQTAGSAYLQLLANFKFSAAEKVKWEGSFVAYFNANPNAKALFIASAGSLSVADQFHAGINDDGSTTYQNNICPPCCELETIAAQPTPAQARKARRW